MDELLLRAAASQVRDHRGRTALHTACYCMDSECSSKVIDEILHLHPNSIKTKCFQGLTPLGITIRCENYDRARKLLKYLHQKKMGEVALIENNYGQIPLHISVCVNTPLDIVESLLSLCHEGTAFQNHKGETPLHLATQFAKWTEGDWFLLRTYPQAILVQDHNGNTPLHYALLGSIENVEAVLELIQFAPAQSLAVTNVDGLTPLHYACIGNAPLTIILALLNVYPNAMTMMGKNGNTPLHYAFMSGASLNLKKKLICDGEYALTMRNMDGKLPLQMSDSVHDWFEIIRAFPHLIHLA